MCVYVCVCVMCMYMYVRCVDWQSPQRVQAHALLDIWPVISDPTVLLQLLDVRVRTEYNQ